MKLTQADLQEEVKAHWIAKDIDLFEELGKPQHVGMGFAITRRYFEDVYKGDIANVPRPDYKHAVWLDPMTENLIVERPSQDGQYYFATPFKLGPACKRLR